MSERFSGGFITKTPVTPTSTSASGIWTLDQQEQYQKAGTWPAPPPPNYIEDVFSTYLYTGNGSSQTITNGIDLSTKGGLVWLKYRTDGGANHIWTDTVRGATKSLYSNATDAQATVTQHVTGFTTSGFSVGNNGNVNDSGGTFASWTFRKQPKFFDVVTYTGAGDGTTVSHNLGSTPGCVIVKATSGVDGWFVYHKDLLSAPPTNRYLRLDKTDATAFLSNWISVSDTTITFPTAYGPTASSGTTYVAYLFAHNAGGFGLTGTDNVISCGSFDATSAGSVELGYEPQWVLIKASNDVGSWHIQDNMRGYTTSGNNPTLDPDRSVAEFNGGYTNPTATGFKYGGLGSSFIYIAIRRGPMKVPTSGTSVYYGATRSGTGATATVTGVPFPPDLLITGVRTPGASYDQCVNDRLRGVKGFLYTDGTAAEITSFPQLSSYNMNGVTLTNDPGAYGTNQSGSTLVNWFFQRAPSFFDEVCYTGDGNLNTSGTVYNVTHNLTVLPELVIIKKRSSGTAENWIVASALSSTQWTRGNGFAINRTDPSDGAINFSSSSYGTATTFRPAVVGGGFSYSGNDSGVTYVAYLFATCAGVSKVGSYTGTGATQTISCGFTGGARFVLIKRTDSTGDWYVWDTARGMVSGTDPSLLLNSTAAEVNANSIYTTTGGFQIVSTAAGINASGGSYIFLAIA